MNAACEVPEEDDDGDNVWIIDRGKLRKPGSDSELVELEDDDWDELLKDISK